MSNVGPYEPHSDFDYDSVDNSRAAELEALEPTEDFPWGDLDPNTRTAAEALGYHIAKQALAKMADFLIEGGRASEARAGKLAYVFAWAIHPLVKDHTQTDLAAILGKQHKQSICREVRLFREHFGWLNQHMQTEEARVKASKRERKKHDQH